MHAQFLPQGINRLGKAAPRPGSLRPPDPTRNRITDHFSENVEGLESDRDYQRAVQDVSEADSMSHLQLHNVLYQPALLQQGVVIRLLWLQIEDAQQTQGWLFGRGGERLQSSKGLQQATHRDPVAHC
jgi:hypothetical protein